MPGRETSEVITDIDLTASATIPSELAGPLPRRLKATGTGVYLALLVPTFLALAVAAALWGGINAARQILHKAELRRGGSEAVGEVTRTRRGKLSDTVYYVFAANGVSVTGKAEVPGTLRYSLRGSNSLPISYLPANPDVNHPAAWEWSLIYWLPQPSDLISLPDFSSELQWIFGSLIFGAPGLAFFLGLRQERKLLAEGAPTTAVITKYSRETRGGFLVEYEFRTEEGRVISGSCSDSLKEVGARVCVLFLTRNPRRNMTYPSSNYRVVQY